MGRAPLEGSDDRILMATLREGLVRRRRRVMKIASAKPFLPNSRRHAAGGERASPRAAATPIDARRWKRER